MNVKFSFDETNVQVGFENQFVVKDFTDKTLVKLLMLKGDKGDTVSAEWGTITGTLSSQTDLKNALDSKANTSDLSSVATSGDYEDLTNTPTIPTKTSDLTNDSGFIDNTVNDLTNYTKTSDLSSVATSGSYNDLSNKPSIPIVNNATLTIQKNSTTIDTFTANSSTDKIIDITVPTSTSDLTNDSGFITSSYHDDTKVDKGVTLFDGATGGNVVLSDTPSNYNTLDIYYNVGSTVLVQTVKANSAYFVLTLSEMDAKVSGNMGIINHYKNYIVNDKTFVVNAAGRLFKYQRDTNVTQDTVDYLWIMKVIGYK